MNESEVAFYIISDVIDMKGDTYYASFKCQAFL